jgi:heme exporter protein D
MSLALVTTVVATSALARPTGGHFGPTIWQGTMLILMPLMMALYYWVWQKEPIMAENDQQRAQVKKWARVRYGILVAYVLIGVVLAVVLLFKSR